MIDLNKNEAKTNELKAIEIRGIIADDDLTDFSLAPQIDLIVIEANELIKSRSVYARKLTRAACAMLVVTGFCIGFLLAVHV